MIGNTIVKHSIVALMMALGFRPDGNGIDLPSDAQIRGMLRVVDQFDGDQQVLIDLGSKLFPAYTRILNSKDVTSRETARVFGALTEVKGDRRQFLEHAVAGLASPNAVVRISAVQLLAQIGSSRDAAPVVSLLSDSEWTIPFAAAETLAAIGDRRTLAAMDVWLNSGNRQNDRLLRERVSKYRDELRLRLQREALPPVAPPPRPVGSSRSE